MKSYDELAAVVKSIEPVLRENAAEAEAKRALPRAAVDAVRNAGCSSCGCLRAWVAARSIPLRLSRLRRHQCGCAHTAHGRRCDIDILVQFTEVHKAEGLSLIGRFQFRCAAVFATC
jgi:hypothetical protein